MKIDKKTIDSTKIGNQETLSSSIREEDMGLAFSMVSESLYSNPIGSFIRELTSNAVDANNDANEVSPVLIEIYRDGDGYYISFKDNGVGMSPEVFKSIYMNWFNSNKRDDNEKIGGWGLGSKSPLSYQDSFEIVTRFDGTEYTYIYSKTDNKPEANLIHTSPTSLSNGTTIIVELEEDDLYKVKKESVSQLLYFNNIYVKNNIHYHDNNYKIYESDDYRIRTDIQQHYNSMHICIGQVVYPIDWRILGLDSVEIPVAITFNIGDLDVTLSRENINYTTKTKVALIAKIKKVKEQLLIMYQKQLIKTDLFEFIKAVKNNDTPRLDIKGIKLNINGNTEYKYLLEEGIEVTANSIASIFSAYKVAVLKSGRKYEQNSDSSRYYYHLYRNPSLCYIKKEKYNYFDTAYISDGYIFTRTKIDKPIFRKIAFSLDLVLNPKEEAKKWIYKSNTSSVVLKLVKKVDSYLNDSIKKYEGVASDEWITNYKEEQAAKKEDTKGNITYYSIDNTRSNVKLKELLEDNKFIFYISKNINRVELLAYYSLYEQSNTFFKKVCKFIIVSPTVGIKLNKFNNVHKHTNLLKIKSFKNYLYRAKISNLVNTTNYDKDSLTLFTSIFDDTLKELYQYREVYKFRKHLKIDAKNSDYFEVNLVEYFKETIDKIKPKSIYIVREKQIKEIETYFKSLKLLPYLKTAPNSILHEYIKEQKILKLKSHYYTSNLNINN